MISPILNSVSDDILKVILTNQNTLKARVRPALVTAWYEVEEGTFLTSMMGMDGLSKSDWGRCGGWGCVAWGRTWDMKWSLAKKVTEVGPCYSKLGVTELQPQVFCFANKVLLEHG